MDIEEELPHRLCSQNHYILDEEKAQMVSDLFKKARAAPIKQKARGYLSWADSLVWRGLMNQLEKVVKFFFCQSELIKLGNAYKRD